MAQDYYVSSYINKVMFDRHIFQKPYAQLTYHTKVVNCD